MPHPAPPSPLIAISPHPTKSGWRTLTVSYPEGYEGQLHIGETVAALLGEMPPLPEGVPGD